VEGKKEGQTPGEAKEKKRGEEKKRKKFPKKKTVRANSLDTNRRGVYQGGEN